MCVCLMSVCECLEGTSVSAVCLYMDYVVHNMCLYVCTSVHIKIYLWCVND